MSLTAAASGFVVFLLSVQVIRGQYDWGVSYTSTEICALKGSTVDINCKYTYPSQINDLYTTVKETFWFTKLNGNEHVDLRQDPKYSGRVRYSCSEKNCTLRITDLRESDSAEYKFRFLTNQPGKSYASWTGVTLSVSDLQVQATRIKVHEFYTEAELKCRSSCTPSGRLSYVWFKNGQKITWLETSSYEVLFYPGDIVSCAWKGHENYVSPIVYAPKVPSVSASPSAEIVEGSSVTLTCSSDANPPAKYTWYRENQTLIEGSDGIYLFSFISSEDDGVYYCKSENEYGQITSTSVHIDVQYAPKVPSVSASPSAEIVEGSSVTLTCSSDANPPANYTWYRENEYPPKASGQIFTIADFRAEHSGNYYCEAQNRRGRHSSTLHLTVMAEKTLMMIKIIRGTLVAVMPIPLLLFCLWMRKKKTLSSPTEPNEPMELESGSDRTNVSALNRLTAAQAEDTEEQEHFV